MKNTMCSVWGILNIRYLWVIQNGSGKLAIWGVWRSGEISGLEKTRFGGSHGNGHNHHWRVYRLRKKKKTNIYRQVEKKTVGETCKRPEESGS